MYKFAIFLLLCVYGSSEKPAVSVMVQRQTALTVVEADSDNDEASVDDESDDADANDIFHPSADWQNIKPGQKIPAGLHIRINLQSGEKQAKLMEKDENPTSSENQYSPEELKKALKNFKSELADSRDDNEKEEKAGSHRSYKELKELLSDQNIEVRTEQEIVTELMQRFNSSTDIAEKVRIFTDLEYYLHQIDVAQDFVKFGGLQLIKEALNSTDSSLRTEAALVLGSALQSNPKVQISVLEEGFLHTLLFHLSVQSGDTERSRMLYALSCLIRHFPLAQEKFVEYGGMAVLTDLLHDPSLVKLQTKAVVLVTDLLAERRSARERYAKQLMKTTEAFDLIKQHERADIEGAIVLNGWCELVPKMLLVDGASHDMKERVLRALTYITPEACHYQQPEVIASLRDLVEVYENLHDAEDSADDYYKQLLQLSNEVLNTYITVYNDEL